MGPRVTAVAIAAILLLAACKSSSPPQAKTSPSSVPSPSAVAWAICGGGFWCGKVQVPLDYSHPGNGTIDIALIRKKATDQANRIGSVLTNPGGPGGSGIDFLRNNSSSLARLNVRFDLIGFDPRGVGASAPVRCLSGPQEDAINALDPVLDDSSEKQATIQADMTMALGCQQQSARVLPFVDTVSAARDMDIIRAAVGDAKLTYLGFSYGTFLGLTYAHLFPTHARALALDGVVDPALSANDLLLTQAKSFEQNLQGFLADCRSRSTCTFAKGGDPDTKLKAMLSRLDTNPLPVGNRLLTRGLAITGVATPLYQQSEWIFLDLALTRADQGNGATLLQLSDIYFGRNSDGTYSNMLDANLAVNCLDRPVPTDIAAYDALGPAIVAASPHFGLAFQYSNLVCAYWPAKPTGQAGPLTADGSPPILLVGGTNDPATPYQWAQSVRQEVTNSVLLTRNGFGHVSYFASSCAQQAEDAYLIDLNVPADGTTCS